MNFSVRYGIENIDWAALCEIFRLAPLGTREPEKLKIAAANSHTVCAAFIEETIIGFGRAISNGQYQSAIYDVVVLPQFQNQGVGQAIMKALLRNLPPPCDRVDIRCTRQRELLSKIRFRQTENRHGAVSKP